MFSKTSSAIDRHPDYWGRPREFKAIYLGVARIDAVQPSWYRVET